MPVSLLIKPVDDFLAQKGLSFLGTMLDIAIIFLLAWVVVFLAKRTIRSIVRRRGAGLSEPRARRLTTAATLLGSAIKYAAYFIAIALSIGELGYGKAMNSMLAAAGIGGLAISIGAQSIIKDVATGLFMLFEDQLSVGDYVNIAGVTGTVQAVTLRTTTVRCYGGELSVIPNGSIGVLTNYSRTDSVAIVEVPIAYEADAERAIALMRQEAEAYYAELGDIATDKPNVLGAIRFESGETVLRLLQRVKPLEHWGVEHELNKRIVTCFVREGIALPQTRMRLVEGER